MSRRHAPLLAIRLRFPALGSRHSIWVRVGTLPPFADLVAKPAFGMSRHSGIAGRKKGDRRFWRYDSA